MRVRTLFAYGVTLCVIFFAPSARAAGLRGHVQVGGAHALGDPQQRELGFGVMGQAAIEVPLARALGVQLEVGGLFLPHTARPLDPTLADHGDGTALGVLAGFRVRPFTEVAGPWFDGNAGYVLTGGAHRFGFDVHAGYDWRIGARWDLGPFVGYTHVLQPDDSLRPEDAHVLMVGLHVGLGVERRPVRADRDHDLIPDEQDDCPDVAGSSTNDRKTNGCPRSDRDKDTVFDDDDACPDVPGIRTSDRKTNGCPRSDRDKDTVFDDEDACPDVPGVRTNNPKTSGCPRPDQDRDTVFDDEDACPKVPGVRTGDPKTNGCPPADASVRVVEDKIDYDGVIPFDTDATHVHVASWPILKSLAKFIVDTPDIEKIEILGHTDERGSEAHNKLLSQGRADAVKQLLVRFGVDKSRLSTEGFADTHPRAQGHGETIWQQNRRVEFVITKVKNAEGGSTSIAPSSNGEKP